MTSPEKSSTAAGAFLVRGGDNDDSKSIEEIEDEALGKISSSAKMAFTAGIVGSASVLRESYKRTSTFLPGTATEQVDLMSRLFDFVFGVGMLRVHYFFSQGRGVDRQSPPNLLKLVNTLFSLWLGVTALFALENVVFAMDLKLPKWTAAMAFLVVVNYPLGEWFHRRSLQTQEIPQEAPEYGPARRKGLGAARNMVWCVGSIGLGGLVDLAPFAVQAHKAETALATAQGAVQGLMCLSEPIIMGGLLASLYKTLLGAVLNITKKGFDSKDPSFREYYQAQTKFYTRVSNFFMWQAVFTVLGYFAPVGEMLWSKYVG